jgi:excisionase family DNA binding protein
MQNDRKTPQVAEQLLTVKDIMELTWLSRGTVYKLISSGELKSVRIGKAVRVRANALKEWMEALPSAAV